MSTATQINSNIRVISEGKATGSVVYWSLNGAVDSTRLDAVLAAIPELVVPQLPSDKTILRRACRAVASGKNEFLLDSHPSGGHLFVGRQVEDGEPTYTGTLRVEVSEDWPLALTFNGLGLESLKTEIRAAYLDRQGKYSTNEISVWLSDLCRKCKAVRLRPMGGFYYVPSAQLPLFRTTVEALRKCSDHVVFEIPATSSRETAAAIVAALKSECEQATQRAQEFAAAGDKGKRAHKSELRRLQETTDKLQAYADFMDGQLDPVIDALNQATVTITQGLLELEAE